MLRLDPENPWEKWSQENTASNLMFGELSGTVSLWGTTFLKDGGSVLSRSKTAESLCGGELPASPRSGSW